MRDHGCAPILRNVYHAHVKHYGEPVSSITFDDAKKKTQGFPDRIDVMVWNPGDARGTLVFSTIGMAMPPLPKASHRAELHFTIRKLLDREQTHEVAYFLANLALYPFYTGQPLDWWHTLGQPGRIPLYSTAQCVLLHPRFAEALSEFYQAHRPAPRVHMPAPPFPKQRT